jgi:hypothetical protein
VSGERGAGLVPTVAGVTVVLALLLAAVQLLTGLYARSAVTAVAFDAARVVAGADAGGRADAVAGAEAEARRLLGRYSSRVTFEWSVDDEVVALRVRARNPRFLLPVLPGGLGVEDVDRTVRVRVERVR